MNGIAFVLVLLVSVAARADDVWALAGSAIYPGDTDCAANELAAGLTAHNPTDTPLVVTLLDTTDPTPLSTHEVTVPPHRTADIWFPTSTPPHGLQPSHIDVQHLDVPPQLLLAANLGFFYVNFCVLNPYGVAAFPSGQVHLPIYRALVPTGETSVHLHTEVPGFGDTRLNVAVYNAGDVPALASVEVHGWDDRVLVHQTFMVAAHALQQATVVPNISKLSESAFVKPLTAPWTLTTHVVVDQPSLSFVSVLSNTGLPQALVTVSE